MQGIVADRAGPATATVGGAVLLAAAVGLLAVSRPGLLTALDDAPTDPAFAAGPAPDGAYPPAPAALEPHARAPAGGEQE